MSNTNAIICYICTTVEVMRGNHDRIPSASFLIDNQNENHTELYFWYSEIVAQKQMNNKYTM